MSDARTLVEVTGLTVYPVKSMRGISLQSARLTPLGFENDRRFMVVRANGAFVTQRDLPLMSLLQTRLEAGGVVISREGYGQVYVPFDGEGGKEIKTRVWKDECKTVDQGEVISGWLTEALESNERLHLVAMADGFVRPQARAGLLGAETRTLFADAAPFLLANEASLQRLNRELSSRGHDAVPMNRFRPNIVIRGPESFAEHRLKALSGENYSLGFRHPCERCIVTTIDQNTASRNPDLEPYKTLCDINPVPGRTGKPAFGHNVILTGGHAGSIRIGDLLQPMENKP